MWSGKTKYQWIGIGLLLGLVCIAGCSAQRRTAPEDAIVDASDPFTDSFFTQPPEWQDSVLRESEVLAKGQDAEPEKPQTFLERSEGVIFSTVLVGASLAKLAFPFLGLGF